MIFDQRIKNNSPESVVLDIVSRKAKLTSKEIYEFFQKKYAEPMSLQGFYKVIKKLVDSRVLLKDGQLISLDSFWVNRLIEFTKTVEDTYLQAKSSSANIILDEGETKTFEFDNIETMDNLWEHGLNIVRNYYLTNKHDDKNVYSRNYYSVFHITRTESETVTLKYFNDAKMNWYMASGSNTFLNKLATKLIEEKNYHQFIFDFDEFCKQKGNIEKNYWVTVIGDFIFEARFPKYIFELLEKIYDQTQSISEFSPNKIINLFREPGKAVLTVARSKKHANEIREEIKKLFRDSK